ncbi:insulinase family protein [Bacillaceae bacterium Marseille-Q3522]|nr:insulinase family protein [Bacillaceae bacterium Marseille-Q3522]
MKLVNEKNVDIGGINLHIIPTEKYKTNTIILRMKAPIRKDDITKRALLPYVLQSSSNKYSTTAALRSYLDDMYGASFYVDLAKKGENHVISFILEVANEKFLSDQTPLLQKAFQFLAEIILHPHATDGVFHAETLQQEKRTLKQKIQSLYDDKMRYANFRLVEEMCDGEPYAIHVNGRAEDMEQISAADLFRYYEQVLAEDQLDLYVVGDVKEEEVTSTVNGLFSLTTRPVKYPDAPQSKNIEKVKKIIEPSDVKQGKLNIGYRTNSYYGDKDYFALQVFNGIFGGFSHSKLFINVREKASLAYYAASRIESHKGLMMVMSGIEPGNFERAVSIIDEQMDAMKKGNFTEDELLQTKAVIKNQLLETIDGSRGLVEILYHNAVAGRQLPFSDWFTEMEKVTKEDVVTVAEKIELDTIYFLTEGKGE